LFIFLSSVVSCRGKQARLTLVPGGEVLSPAADRDYARFDLVARRSKA
jgi:hypothetical protein